MIYRPYLFFFSLLLFVGSCSPSTAPSLEDKKNYQKEIDRALTELPPRYQLSTDELALLKEDKTMNETDLEALARRAKLAAETK